MPDTPLGVKVKLWDWPVRLVHWLLVGLLGFSWWAADDHLDWHQWSGYAVIALLVFRIYSGFAGGGAARFVTFVRGPRVTLAYLKTLGGRTPATTPGHNPLGALSIVLILALLLAQVTLSLFAVDVDDYQAGPLSDRVSFDLGRQIAEWHDLSFHALQAVAAVHVVAVLFYLVWKRTNLIGPMITGWRRLPQDPDFAPKPVWRLVVGVILAAGVAWSLSKGLRF